VAARRRRLTTSARRRTAAAATPAGILNIGTGTGQNHFALQMARSGDAAITTYSLADLAAGYSETPYFVPTADAARVQFWVQADAPTTSGTSFPRSELREVNADGTNMGFDANTGEHILEGRSTVTHVPDADPEVVFAQLHNGSTDRIAIRTQLVSGTTRGRVRVNGTSVHEFANPYTVGTEVHWKIRLVNGAVEVYIGNMTTPAYTAAAGTLAATTGVTTWYFKAGAYAQFDETTVAATEYTSVELRGLTTSHS
jgi:hypothetical protein